MVADLPSRPLTLYLAPEACLKPLWPRLGRVVTADISSEVVDLICDAEALPVRRGSLDVYFAIDVLEHVSDDRQAMAEMAAALRPGGFAFVHVPVLARETIEYDQPNPLESFHVRMYGPDVTDRLGQAGLEVRRIAVADGDGLGSRHGLVQTDFVLVARRPAQ